MAGQIIDSVAKSGKQYGTHLFKVRSEVLCQLDWETN